MEERADATIIVVADGDCDFARWLVEGVEPADLAVVDRLARLQLAARRVGLTIQVREPSGKLRGLLDLVGLDRVLSSASTPQPDEATISPPARGTSAGPSPGTAPDTRSGASQ
ncbi:MAG TPA: hypothetical protein VHA73_11920 [Acidimicrobiales bacterium]|nr:hypothetical protein [Acidimicrobiales bacterium]